MPLTRKPRRRALALVAAAAALAAPIAAFAGTSADVTVTATISPASLTLTTSATPTLGVTLDGTDQTATYTLPFTVDDPRGTGAGWNVTITSTAFADGGGDVFANDASAVTAASSACAGGTTCTDATNGVALPVTVPAAATAPAAVKLFDAAAGTGMGKVAVTPTVQVSIPSSTFAGTYTSTVSLAVASGP